MWILQSAARVGSVSIGPEHPSLLRCMQPLSYRDINTTLTNMNTSCTAHRDSPIPAPLLLMSVHVDINLSTAVWTRLRPQPKVLSASSARVHTRIHANVLCVTRLPREHFSNASLAPRFAALLDCRVDVVFGSFVVRAIVHCAFVTSSLFYVYAFGCGLH